MDPTVQVLGERGQWHSRKVNYFSGSWEQLQNQLPLFTIEDFQVGPEEPPNPYLKAIIRQPITLFERPIPVGTVSHTYSLAQHTDVAQKCLEGIESIGIKSSELKCELGLTELGEWMNLRIYFPERYTFYPVLQDPIRLRLECMNSVNGSSRLIVFLSWLRVICSNGMVVRESKAEIKDIHNEHLNLRKIPLIVGQAMTVVEDDIRQLSGWAEKLVFPEDIEIWTNKTLSDKWGVKAACRVFHICTTGHDVDFLDPFAPGKPTEKPVKKLERVPGSPEKATTLYDVSQAMSWIATSRNNTEERLAWQSNIPDIISKLETVSIIG